MSYHKRSNDFRDRLKTRIPTESFYFLAFLAQRPGLFPTTFPSASLSESPSASRSPMNCSVDGRDLDCHGLDGHVLDCPVLDDYALDGRDPDWCARNLRSIVDWEDSFCLDEKNIFHVETQTWLKPHVLISWISFCNLSGLRLLGSRVASFSLLASTVRGGSTLIIEVPPPGCFGKGA